MKNWQPRPSLCCFERPAKLFSFLPVVIAERWLLNCGAGSFGGGPHCYSRPHFSHENLESVDPRASAMAPTLSACRMSVQPADPGFQKNCSPGGPGQIIPREETGNRSFTEVPGIHPTQGVNNCPANWRAWPFGMTFDVPFGRPKCNSAILPGGKCWPFFSPFFVTGYFKNYPLQNPQCWACGPLCSRNWTWLPPKPQRSCFQPRLWARQFGPPSWNLKESNPDRPRRVCSSRAFR